MHLDKISNEFVGKQECQKKIEQYPSFPKRIEYILEWNLLEKKYKTAILLYCFHSAGVLLIFVLYNLLCPGTSFYRKSKINIKKNPNYEIGWFHN